jgi:hypothetical protein
MDITLFDKNMNATVLKDIEIKGKYTYIPIERSDIVAIILNSDESSYIIQSFTPSTIKCLSANLHLISDAGMRYSIWKQLAIQYFLG